MKRNNKWIGLMIVCLIIAWASALVAVAGLESKYTSHATSAAVNFGPGTGRTVAKSIYATTDKEGGCVKLYARASAGKAAVTAAPTNGATVVYIANASYSAAAGFTTNDLVMYVHSNGTLDYTTVSAATATNITLAAGVSQAGSTDDYVYELSQQGEIIVGFDGTATGTNDTLATTGDVFVTPGDSPLRAVLDGTATAKIQVTVDK